MPPKQKRVTKSSQKQRQPRRGQGRNIDYKQFPQLKNQKFITNGDIRRLARRGGVKRISSDVYELSKMFMKMYIQQVVKDSMIYANYAGRSTLLADDICMAAKRAGQTAIGFSNRS